MVQKTKVKSRLKDIAEATGYSLMTVSLALNPRDSVVKVSEKTRRKIVEAARAMNYMPNLTARTLARGSSNTVGVLFSSIRESFFSELLIRIDLGLRKHQLTGFYGFWSSQSEFEQVLARMAADNVCGIITGHDGPADYPDVPVICYGIRHPDYESIYPDQEAMVRCGVEFLLKLGHRRIGFVSSVANHVRVELFRRVMAEYGLPDSPASLISEEHYGRVAAARLSEQPSAVRPTAVLTASDQGAYELIAALQDRGCRVPDEISVAGINNLPGCDDVSPRLSSVDFDLGHLGDLLTTRLAERLKDSDCPRRDRVLSCRMVERKSCRPFTAAASQPEVKL